METESLRLTRSTSTTALTVEKIAEKAGKFLEPPTILRRRERFLERPTKSAKTRRSLTEKTEGEEYKSFGADWSAIDEQSISIQNLKDWTLEEKIGRERVCGRERKWKWIGWGNAEDHPKSGMVKW